MVKEVYKQYKILVFLTLSIAFFDILLEISEKSISYSISSTLIIIDLKIVLK